MYYILRNLLRRRKVTYIFISAPHNIMCIYERRYHDPQRLSYNTLCATL